MRFELSDEQEMIVSTVRAFVEREIYPHETAVERAGTVDPALADELKRRVIDLDLYACTFPAEVGGTGLSHLDFALVEREFGRGSMALTHFFGRPQTILMACAGDQRERYLLPAVRGEKMGALAMTEPEAGSDIRSMRCMARREGGDWVLDGAKQFISGADHADFFISFVATGVDETDRGPEKRITCFMVDLGHPGFTVREGYRSVSHRGDANCIREFDGCRLPGGQVLGAVDGGFAVMNEWLHATRITVAAASVSRRPAARCGDARQSRDRLGQARRHGDARARDRRGAADPWRHGADGRSAGGRLLARRAGGADPLGRLLAPCSVAMVGGGVWAENVIDQLGRIGFAGALWPVHPRRAEVGGQRAVPRLEDLTGVPDVAFLMINPEASVEAVAVLAAMGAGCAVCVASGWAGAGAELPDGPDLQARLVAAAGDMPVLGPNC